MGGCKKGEERGGEWVGAQGVGRKLEERDIVGVARLKQMKETPDTRRRMTDTHG